MKKRKRGLFALIKVNWRLVALGAVVLLLGCGALMAGAVSAEGVEVPVVMYHSVLKDESRHGDYVIAPAEFESDVRYLREHGYTTVLIKDLIQYTQGGGLPEKPVLLTFDDGYYNNYLYAFPIAKQYGCKFVLSPIGKYAQLYTDTPDENAYYSHATWPQLREMAQSGLVEVQNHSYDLHSSTGGRLGVKQKAGESAEAYAQMLKGDLLQAQTAIEEQVGARPTAFVYPFGAVSKATPALVKEMGFLCTLSCEEKVSRVTRDPASLYGLGRFLRRSGVSTEAFFEHMGL